MVRLWPIIRYATLLFWIVIIPIGFAIKPTLRPHDNSSLFTWYIIPAVCFFVSFLPYFYYSTATKIFSGESFTESVPGFNRFLLLNSALSGFLVPIYQVLTAEFMQEAALALVAVIPATFISAVVVCILLHQKVKPRPEPIRSEV
ncbi:MAG: hypothetical protein JXA30_14720 [Deltaproteobacteria bacterium]|nr:hypothetical protein [Deltaproteobacteria bacterium]